MSALAFWRRGVVSRAVGIIAVVALIVGGVVGGLVAAGGGDTMHLTAYFPQTIGLYVGNAVDVMGVKIGSIDKLTDVGGKVRVDISYDGSQRLPANVRAVMVTPSVVSDRYIQLTPAYTGGPALPNDAVLNTDRTAVPLEFDDIFKNLDQLNVALGPKGANKHGALSRLIQISEQNLHGNGGRLNSALKNFTEAISTLSGNRGNLFSTIGHLQSFTTTIARDDGGVRALNRNLAKVGGQLSNERHDLGAALANLSSALQLVNSFVASNRSAITSDLHGATKVSKDLQVEKRAITQLVNDAPLAVANLALAGDPKAYTLDTKANLSYTGTPAQLCSSFLRTLGQVPILGSLLGGSGQKACSGLPKSASGSSLLGGLTGKRSTLPASRDGLGQLLGGVKR